MAIEKELFGTDSQQQDIWIYTLRNKSGIEARIMERGATLVSLKTPDLAGEFNNIVLGYSSLAEYEQDSCYFGCTVGRVANRINKGRFQLDGRNIQLATNDHGMHHLHGGDCGFDKKRWESCEVEDEDGQRVHFTLMSPDGEENYPGNVQVEVVYRLTLQDELIIEYKATTDKRGPLNLTNHSYFNLNGAAGANILNHQLSIHASFYTPSDQNLIPTGELKSVKATPFDFLSAKPIGQDIAATGGGYDHNYAIDRQDNDALAMVAEVHSPLSGRRMQVLSTEPGVQLYTGNFLNGIKTEACTCRIHQAFCLETQHFPDAVNQPNFKDIWLNPGELYRQITVHRFSTSP